MFLEWFSTYLYYFQKMYKTYLDIIVKDYEYFFDCVNKFSNLKVLVGKKTRREENWLGFLGDDD